MSSCYMVKKIGYPITREELKKGSKGMTRKLVAGEKVADSINGREGHQLT